MFFVICHPCQFSQKIKIWLLSNKFRLLLPFLELVSKSKHSCKLTIFCLLMTINFAKYLSESYFSGLAQSLEFSSKNCKILTISWLLVSLLLPNLLWEYSQTLTTLLCKLKVVPKSKNKIKKVWLSYQKLSFLAQSFWEFLESVSRFWLSIILELESFCKIVSFFGKKFLRFANFIFLNFSFLGSGFWKNWLFWIKKWSKIVVKIQGNGHRITR